MVNYPQCIPIEILRGKVSSIPEPYPAQSMTERFLQERAIKSRSTSNLRGGWLEDIAHEATHQLITIP